MTIYAIQAIRITILCESLLLEKKVITIDLPIDSGFSYDTCCSYNCNFPVAEMCYVNQLAEHGLLDDNLSKSDYRIFVLSLL